MGGHGSGRLNKTDAFLKKNSDPFKTVSNHIATVGGAVLVVPNHSGISTHPEIKKMFNDIFVGTIMIWSGSIASIPTGWNLCDGTNGTEDLRNEFIVGAGDTYAVDDSAGNASHSHALSTIGSAVIGTPSATTAVATGGITINVATLDHTHALSGGTETTTELPPYLAKAYIQFLGI